MIESLSDGELRERLAQRGLSSSDVEWLIWNRESPEAAEEIERVLDA